MTYIEQEEFDNELEQDEKADLEERRAEAREMARLTNDKQVNYAMIRKLRPITDSNSWGYGIYGSLRFFGLLQKDNAISTLATS